jgi:hypothetical protein
MSIDMSSVIPVIHAIDIKINREEDSQVVRPVEESSESGNSGPQFNREGYTEVIRDNLSGVGDTYSTKGELVKEISNRSNGDKKMAIDMII